MYNIEKRRKELGLTLEQVGKACGVGKSTVKKWETGCIENMKRDKILSLSKILSVSPLDIIGLTDAGLEIMPREGVYNVPIYESVSAGFGAFADNQIVDYAPLYIPSEQEAMNTLCIRVSGDSMFPTIEDGDLIQVEKTESVDSGTVAVLLIEGEDAVVKKVVYTTDRIELRSFNPMYPPRVFEGADVLRVSVIGRVKKVIKTL